MIAYKSEPLSDMRAHKIAISPCTYIELGLKSITFATREDAIDCLEEAFYDKSIIYSTEEAHFGNVVYKDHRGGKLAEVFSMITANAE